ncbi:MAG: hypothetical protein J4G04_03305 [Nitrosopumilaceae archaeon]|nr:hypothetical protein [Nitrosopumilaceae archaeon]
MTPAAGALACMACAMVWCGAAHADIHLYVPDSMLQNTHYEGMALLDEPAAHPYTLLLASEGPVRIPHNITIQAGTNHGIFGIYPYGAGEARISAVPPGGPPAHATSSIHPDAPRLRLILPGAQNLAATHMPVFIFLTDGAGRPLPAPHAIPIHLDAPPSIDIPGTATIHPGRTHATVQAAIHGSGTIHASSKHAAGDSAEILWSGADISVRVGVAPNPAPEGSAAAYFVWLERDGYPYDPPHHTQVLISSDSPAASTAPGPGPGPVRRGAISGGIYSGTIHTGQVSGPGDARAYGNMATITATVPGVGSGSATISVGAHPAGALDTAASALRDCVDASPERTRHIPCGRMLGAFAALGGTPDQIYDGAPPDWIHAAFRAADARPRADAALLWAFPDTPHHTAWVVAGFYATGGIPGIWVPAPPPDTSDIVTSHSAPRRTGTGPVTIPMDTPAPLNLTISGGGISPAGLALPGPARPDIRISWEPAPHTAGPRLLGIIYVTDHAGRALHPGHTMHNLTVSGYGNTTIHHSIPYGAAAAIYGESDGSGGVLARLPGAPPARIPTNPNATHTITLWMPDRVHVAEEFPYAIHAVSGDTPTHRIYDAALASGSVSPAPGHRLVADRTGGDMAVVWEGAAAWDTTEPFLNEMPRIRIDTGETQVRLDQNITISIHGAPPGAQTYADGPLAFSHTPPHSYTARPAEAGQYTVNVTVSAPGWHPHSRAISYSADTYADVSYMATSSDSAPVPFKMRLESDDTSYTLLPGQAIPLAPGAYTATLEHNVRLDGSRYTLSGVTINGAESGNAGRLALTVDGPTHITSRYERVVEVRASYTGVLSGPVPGSGDYSVGDTVHIRAGPVPVWWGLARAVPASWEGLPPDHHTFDDTVRFPAAHSVDIRAEYRTDHTPLMLLAGAAASVPILLMRGRIADALGDIRGRGS